MTTYFHSVKHTKYIKINATQ